MSREAGLWNRVTRIQTGGVHAYIPKEAVAKALEAAGLPEDIKKLRMKATWMKTSRKGRARILIEIEENGGDASETAGANKTLPPAPSSQESPNK